LKLNNDEPVSNFAFNFNLRRHIKPDLILISAGFDAHAKDEIQGPVNLGVKEADYEWLTEELCKIANTYGLADTARHVIQRKLNPRFLSYLSCYDVAN